MNKHVQNLKGTVLIPVPSVTHASSLQSLPMGRRPDPRQNGVPAADLKQCQQNKAAKVMSRTTMHKLQSWVKPWFFVTKAKQGKTKLKKHKCVLYS